MTTNFTGQLLALRLGMQVPAYLCWSGMISWRSKMESESGKGQISKTMQLALGMPSQIIWSMGERWPLKAVVVVLMISASCLSFSRLLKDVVEGSYQV